MQDKRDFYRRPEITESYNQQRFGGASGSRVNRREIELVLGMLPSRGCLLDLACGTGRLTAALVAAGREVVGADASPGMAEQAAGAGAPVVVADAFQTPFVDRAFAAAISLRFAFHFANLDPLLREMQRVVAPGGSVIFDTYSWSPRAALALGARRWGGRVHLHSRREVAAIASRLGLRVEHVEPCFLFSPYLYRLAPLPLERAFEALEPHVPRSWLCRVFWKLGTP